MYFRLSVSVRYLEHLLQLWQYLTLSLSLSLAIFEKGLAGNNLSSAKDSLQLWTAYLDYLRRRVRIHDNQVHTNESFM